MELKIWNLSLRIKCSFSKINSAFFGPSVFYSTFTKPSSYQRDYVIRNGMRKLFSENNFLKNTCYLISHVAISEINMSAA